MANPALRANTWTVDGWYDQAVAGTTGGYNGVIGGELYTWGNNSGGILGHNNMSPSDYSSPRQVPGTTWSDINSGAPSNSSIAAKSDGTLWTWGSNQNGALGQNQPGPSYRSSPVQVGTDTTWAALSDEDSFNTYKLAVGDTALAIKSDGTLWSWGAYKGTAQNNDTQYSSPTQVGTDTTWKSVAIANPGTTAGLKTDGTLWGWGDNNSGQLGQNQASAQVSKISSPAQVPGTWSTFDCGEYVNGGIKTDGTLWMWGSNSRGELGQNDGTWQNRRSSPVQVPGTTWSKISVGEFQVAAIKTNGTFWSWGYNAKGQLGLNEAPNGQPGSYSSPTQVGTDTTWRDVNIQGAQSCFAVKTDGTLWSWGYNYKGRLGLNQGTPVSRSSPTQIGSQTDVIRLGGGQYNTMYIRNT
jgi:alpha-tubulin suppressor-like RCC1 family protein